MGETGEFSLLGELLPQVPTRDDVVLGPGDDGAVLALDGNLVVSTDVLVEGVHFRRDWSSANDVGRKAIAVNVSDIEAMGASPRFVVIALSVPADLDAAWVRDFHAGVLAECEAADVVLVGGDTTRSRDVTVAVTVMGATTEAGIVTRAGATPGDVVALCGRTGWAAAGLAVLSRGFRSPRAAVDAQRVPQTPYGQGVVAARAGATAMIDVSDGLLADLCHVADASGVAIDLDPDAFVVPEPLAAVGAATGADPMAFLLAGGEDQALAATFPAGGVPEGWRVVGTVAVGSGVTVGGSAWDGSQGWDHFGKK